MLWLFDVSVKGHHVFWKLQKSFGKIILLAKRPFLSVRTTLRLPKVCYFDQSFLFGKNISVQNQLFSVLASTLSVDH